MMFRTLPKMVISIGQRKVQTDTMKAYRKQWQYVYRHCQLGHVTPGNTLIIAICILMLPMLQLTTEHAQLVTTYHVTPINHVDPHHMNFSHAPLVLSSLNNVLSAMGIQNELASSNSRCQSSHSRTSHVFPNPAVIVPFSLGKTVEDVMLALLLLRSGDVEVNPGPVGKKLIQDDLGCVLEEVVDVSAQWYPLGLQLKVKTGTLDSIRTQFQNPRDQLLEMLKTWLNTSDNASWTTLTDALRSRSVGACQLAAALGTKYCLGKETEVHTGAMARKSIPPPVTYQTVPGQCPHQVDKAERGMPTSEIQSVTPDAIHTENTHPNHPGDNTVLLDKQSVKQQVKKLEKRFSGLVHCAYIALVQKNTEDNVRYFRSSFLSLDVSRKRQHHEFIHEQLIKVDKKATFDEIWVKLTDYWNFLNFDLLEYIVDKFDIEDLKQKMESYEHDLWSFRKSTRLCDFIYCWPVQGESPPEAELREFVAKMKHDWDNCTLEDLESLKGVITRKFFLPEFALLLKQIKEGCVVITWLIPTSFVKALQEAIKTTNSEFFMEHKIKAITIDGQDCYSSATAKNAGYWQKPSVSIIHPMLVETLGLVKPDTCEEETMTHSDEKAWLPTPRHHTTPDSGYSSRCSNNPSSSSSSQRQVESLASVQQYLDKAEVEADSSLPTKFKDYLSSTPAIRAALYTTFNAKVAAEVFTWSHHTDSPLPTTMTELFTAFTLKTLVNHLSTHPVYCEQHLKVTTFSDLPTDVYKQFQDLCRIAYEDILKRQQQVFLATHHTTRFASIGLMQEPPQMYIEGRVSSYHFIHLTLQEYLAAFHMTQLPAYDQTKLVQEYLDSDRFKLTLRFLAGLTKIANIPPDITMESDDTRLTYLHFLFEARDISVTTRTLGSDEIVVKSRYSWTTLDYYVTGYAISHSNYTWKVDFSRYSNEDEFEFFCQGCAAPGKTRCRGHILHADFKQNQITAKSIESFANIPKYIIQNMQGLHLSLNILDGRACDLLAKIIPSMCRLEELWLNNNPIESGGAVEMIKALCGSGVKELLLYNTGIGEPDCEALCKLLKSSYSLQHLDIDQNSLSSESVTSIITGLSHNSSLTELYISNSHFSMANVDSLASLLLTDQSKCTLTKLVLRNCNIDGQGASKLAAALCENSTLKHINLNHNPIGVKGASSMSDMLQHNTSLEELYLLDDSVGKEGIHQLIEGLKRKQTPRKVQLSKKYDFMDDKDHKIEWL